MERQRGVPLAQLWWPKRVTATVKPADVPGSSPATAPVTPYSAANTLHTCRGGVPAASVAVRCNTGHRRHVTPTLSSHR